MGRPVDGFAVREKADIRREVLGARRAMDPCQRQRHDAALARAAAELIRARSARVVAGYAPMTGEPGGVALTDALLAVSTRLILPVLRTDRDLDWARYQGPASLHTATGHPVRSSVGTREPAGPRLGRHAIAEAEIIFVPALAVDEAGIRLGRGGGSYDRALARTSRDNLVVALLYPGEVWRALPAQSHDRPVHAVITASGELIRFAGGATAAEW